MLTMKSPVTDVKGIGKIKAKALAKLGIANVEDLVCFYPRAYDDRRMILEINKLIPGTNSCIRARISRAPEQSRTASGISMIKITAYDNTGSIDITFFGFSKLIIRPDTDYIFYGKISKFNNKLQMTGPVIEAADSEPRQTRKIVPIYHLTAGIRLNEISSYIRNAIQDVHISEIIPKEYVLENTLCSAEYAYRTIHNPKNEDALYKARQRLVFEELFILGCIIQMTLPNNREKGIQMRLVDIGNFTSRLPYKLTEGQKKAITEAFDDMTSGNSMMRLLQGDVGSGKTVVAAACAWLCAENGYQTAIMAPSEILAEQHYITFAEYFRNTGIDIAILTGSMSREEKENTKGKIRSGKSKIVIGTHALFSENVKFANLALAITDEQHRFGIAQRKAISEKGDNVHILLMSATPIPKTLAMSIYGEMDVSKILVRPKGREAVKSLKATEDMRIRVYKFARSQLKQGRQIYIICPRAVPSDEEDEQKLAAVESYTEKIRPVFKEYTVDGLHAKMDAQTQEQKMSDFKSGKTDILVSTTIIEVGIDVPNASLIIIENAERFGLSQLHQLRGRVGRGNNEGYCVFFDGLNNEKSAERLDILCKTTDGFEVANIDLALRGPGQFFSNMQHGLPELKIADYITDTEIIEKASEASKRLLKDDPQLNKTEHAGIKNAVQSTLDKIKNREA